MSKKIYVAGKGVELFSLKEIGKEDWLAEYWRFICSSNPTKQPQAPNLPIFLRTSTFKNPDPYKGTHDITPEKWVLAPISVSEFDSVEADYYNLQRDFKDANERMRYARNEYDLAKRLPKQLLIDGESVVTDDEIDNYYVEVPHFTLTVDPKSTLAKEFDIPYPDPLPSKPLDASIVGHCVAMKFSPGEFNVNEYGHGPFGNHSAGAHCIKCV